MVRRVFFIKRSKEIKWSNRDQIDNEPWSQVRYGNIFRNEIQFAFPGDCRSAEVDKYIEKENTIGEPVDHEQAKPIRNVIVCPINIGMIK